MNKFLIINADDFGMDKASADGILDLAEKGLITSATIMANCVRERELKKLSQYTNISRGLHLNLISGEPISKASSVRTLIDRNGRFYSLKELFFRFLQKKVRIEEIEREIISQLQHIYKYGFEISHVDSHRHLHNSPLLGPIIMQILKKNGVKKIRKCNMAICRDIRMMVVKFSHLLTAVTLGNMQSPDVLIAPFSIKKDANLDIFKKAIERVFRKNNVVEFMTHPAVSDREDSYLARKAEYDFWLKGNWKDYIRRQNIELISYGKI